MYTIEFLPIAEADLSDIIVYLADENFAAAEKLLATIEHKLELSKKNPNMGAIPRDEVIRKTGIRYLVIETYSVFYIVFPEKIQLRRILHGKRDYSMLLK